MKPDRHEEWKEINYYCAQSTGYERTTFKMRVSGGWIYRVSTNKFGESNAEAMVFVPYSEEHGEVEGL